jgi:hypothetical protein
MRFGLDCVEMKWMECLEDILETGVLYMFVHVQDSGFIFLVTIELYINTHTPEI